MKNCVLSLILALPLALNAVSLDHFITPSKQKTMGLNRLTSKEKTQLAEWIQHHLALRESDLFALENNLRLVENIHGGRAVRLSDSTLWEVDPKDRLIASEWLFPSEMTLVENKGAKYPYTLTNLATKTRIRVRPLEKN